MHIKRHLPFWTAISVGITLRVWAALSTVSPVSDFKRYFDVATEFAITGALAHNGIPFISQPPLYPLVLGMLFKITGSSVAVAVELNLFLSVASILLFGAAMFRLKVDRRVQWIAMSIFAIYPGLSAYVSLLGTETISVFLVCATMLLVTHRSRGMMLLTGFVIGCLALSRPQYLPVVVVLLGILMLQRRVIASASVTLGLAIVLGPWIHRNYVEFHVPVAVSANGGYVAFVNNNSDNQNSGWMPLSKIAISKRQAEAFDAAGGEHLFDPGVESEKMYRWTPALDGVALHEAFSWIAEHKIRFVELATLRIRKTFVNPGWSMLQWVIPPASALFSGAIVVTNLLTAGLSIAALICAFQLRKQWRSISIAIPVSMIALALLSVIVFEGQGRYVLPVLPAMLVIVAMRASQLCGSGNAGCTFSGKDA